MNNNPSDPSDFPPFIEPSDNEIALLTDQALSGPPKKLAAADGIAQMTARRDHLLAELKRSSEAADRFPDRSENFAAEMTALRRQLADTNARLAEYQTQLEGLN